ncbi:MAG: hypothetical protein GY710_02130 [Desulfobacteraceae bacterium]|nr:hypothetical protein [Desulfobacteraceae bacterium]
MSTEFFNLNGKVEAVRRASPAGCVLELRVSLEQWEKNTCLHELHDNGKLLGRAEVEQNTTIIPLTAHRLNQEARDLEDWAENHDSWDQADWARNQAADKRKESVFLVRNSLRVC